ncbi:MAG: AAA family ATPase [Anaerotignum faecicola]
MLLEFACSNHKSIRDEVLFSALASKDNTFEEKTKEISGGRVLKSAIIYGANGAGKSNLIDAIAFVKNIVINSINHQPGQGIRQIPHKLDGFKKDSTYRIQFIVQNVRYVFGFSLRNMLVSDEYLYYFPNNRQTKIYERSGETFSAGNKFRGKFNTCKDVLKPNRLLLSCAANFSAVKEISDAYSFFNDELVVYDPTNQYNWMNYSLYQMNTNPKMKQSVLNFLSELGTGIRDIQVMIDEKELESSELPPFLSDEFKALLLQNNVNAITARVCYDKFDVDLMQDESTGIQKLFGILCPIIDIMINGKVLICDELESSLHESLVFGLVKLFMGAQTDKFAQMIFTTHETGLLNLELFRRDQIWFAEMRKDDRSTDLYSLAEIKNVRKEDNFGRGYISGKYGAIPMLNLNFADIVSEM